MANQVDQRASLPSLGHRLDRTWSNSTPIVFAREDSLPPATAIVARSGQPALKRTWSPSAPVHITNGKPADTGPHTWDKSRGIVFADAQSRRGYATKPPAKPTAKTPAIYIGRSTVVPSHQPRWTSSPSRSSEDPADSSTWSSEAARLRDRRREDVRKGHQEESFIIEWLETANAGLRKELEGMSTLQAQLRDAEATSKSTENLLARELERFAQERKTLEGERKEKQSLVNKAGAKAAEKYRQKLSDLRDREKEASDQAQEAEQRAIRAEKRLEQEQMPQMLRNKQLVERERARESYEQEQRAKGQREAQRNSYENLQGVFDQGKAPGIHLEYALADCARVRKSGRDYWIVALNRFDMFCKSPRAVSFSKNYSKVQSAIMRIQSDHRKRSQELYETSAREAANFRSRMREARLYRHEARDLIRVLRIKMDPKKGIVRESARDIVVLSYSRKLSTLTSFVARIGTEQERIANELECTADTEMKTVYRRKLALCNHLVNTTAALHHNFKDMARMELLEWLLNAPVVEQQSFVEQETVNRATERALSAFRPRIKKLQKLDLISKAGSTSLFSPYHDHDSIRKFKNAMAERDVLVVRKVLFDHQQGRISPGQEEDVRKELHLEYRHEREKVEGTVFKFPVRIGQPSDDASPGTDTPQSVRYTKTSTKPTAVRAIIAPWGKVAWASKQAEKAKINEKRMAKRLVDRLSQEQGSAQDSPDWAPKADTSSSKPGPSGKVQSKDSSKSTTHSGPRSQGDNTEGAKLVGAKSQPDLAATTAPGDEPRDSQSGARRKNRRERLGRRETLGLDRDKVRLAGLNNDWNILNAGATLRFRPSSSQQQSARLSANFESLHEAAGPPEHINLENLTIEDDHQGALDSAEQHEQLSFQIPEQDLRAAMLASDNNDGAYWKYTLYKSPAGKPVMLFMCSRLETSERAAQRFLNEKVIGFDIEWEIGARPGIDGIKDNVSLIQIASESGVALFQIASFVGNTADELMPPTLRRILESPHIIKAGVNIAGDFTRLRKCFGIEGQGIFELSHLFRVVKFSENWPDKVNKLPWRLADQVQEILFLPLAKGAVRTSSWSQKLSHEQMEYAASDAYAGFRLFFALEEKRKAMHPTPPRPALYELKLPLLLSNGQPPPARTKQPNQQAADASEEQAGPAEEVEAGDDEEGEGDTESSDAVPGDRSHGQVVPAKELCGPRPEWEQAEQWIAEWRTNLPAHRVVRASTTNLRSYALWHEQGLPIDDVARLSRVSGGAPLKQSTVALYILEAVRLERDLPFDAGRIREALRCIPPNANARFQWLMKRVDGGKAQHLGS